MCGITGFWQQPSGDESTLKSCVQAMNDTLIHRGPDDHGVWVDACCGVALGNRRLAILDLSQAGHQPMTSSCGRYVIAYNGEIYNFAEIRRELEAENRCFRGHSDTEVIVEGCANWGIQATVERLNGMFALALWDRRERTLTLIRDRLGIKPLYYGWCGDAFVFGSELKALQAHPNFVKEVNRDSLVLMMRYGYIPAPHSIFKDILKLSPGHMLTINQYDRKIDPNSYWSAEENIAQSKANLFAEGESKAIEQFNTLLSDAVRRRMIADVPLGAFLSGGVDSSTVVALMQAQSNRSVRTFTIGFHESKFNEADHAKQVAKHLGTNHTELYLDASQVQSLIARLPQIYDEPFADQSQLPTLMVSELARKHVTVSLSGDGGDELFGGYWRYRFAQWGKIPVSLRKMGALGFSSLSSQQWDRLFAACLPLLPKAFRMAHPGDKLHKLAQILPAHSPEAFYHSLVSIWHLPHDVVVDGCEPETPFCHRSRSNEYSFIDWMMLLDLNTYLPEDILAKVDRASMAVSLEARVPLLDHRVVNFAWQLPRHYKIRHRQQKWLLRQVLYRYVPARLIERPKQGFSLPIDAWLRGPLRDWAEALLDEQRLKYEGFLKPEQIRQKWIEHVNGDRNWRYPLWNVLMFQAWHEHWLGKH